MKTIEFTKEEMRLFKSGLDELSYLEELEEWDERDIFRLDRLLDVVRFAVSQLCEDSEPIKLMIKGRSH